MLTKMTDKEKELTIKNIESAVKDIDKLNKRGYHYLNLASGFIAHYDINGFIEYYKENSLKEDILRHLKDNKWDNFRKGEKDYEYYSQKGEIYAEICERIKNIETKLKAEFCDKCGSRIA